MTDWVADTLAALTLDEKLQLLAGRDLWHTAPIDRLGLPALKVTDGPNGARGADGNHGPTSTSFPVGAAMGATWDPDLIELVGRALADETIAKGAHVLLGPTVNIPRVPNAGRNFECFSEDPLLSGVMAAAWIRGVQSEGVSACIKHFVCNDQEHDRYDIDAVVDERALREIYLEPFRIAIESARPWAVMSAYNSVNGTTASEHPMLDEILRDEFGFDGLVMSDWYGTYGPGVMSSGLDLEMPGPGRWLAAGDVRSALESGDLTEDRVDLKVGRLLALIERAGVRERPGDDERALDDPSVRALVRRVAAESTVLLVNDGVLPLGTAARIAVIGELAVETPHQGGGSSSVNPHRIVSVLEGIRSAVPSAEVTWTPGCQVRRRPRPLAAACLGESGLLIEYFDGEAPEGLPVRSLHSTRSFLSFFGTRDQWVDHDRFAVRLKGTYEARSSGIHELSFGAVGRLRALLDGVVVIDRWDEPADGSAGTSVDLAEGEKVVIEVEYASVPGERWRWLSVGCVEPSADITIGAAVDAAATADVAVVVAGLTPEWESEGFDRPDLRLPGMQDDLIAAVAERQPNTVVVLTGGSAVEMPWVDDVAAAMVAWYGGQEVGHAVADVLFGRAEPGGRLPVTFPMTSRQHPGLLNYPGEAGRVRYGEGVYVGYRAYDRLGLTPRFAFGHGLSYTSFSGTVHGCSRTDDTIGVDLTVSNTGARPGSEVVQVYARGLGDLERKLVAFEKIRLDSQESRRSTTALPISRLQWWDVASGSWRAPDGAVTLEVVVAGVATEITADLDPI